MTHQSTKPRFSFRDHLTAYLVLLLILVVILVGAFVLYMSGLFDPVVVEGTPLENVEPLNLPTVPPAHEDDAFALSGLVGALFPVASAEGVQAPEAAAAEPADAQQPASADELTQLLEQIVAEEDGEEEIPESARVTVGKDDLSKNANLPQDVYSVLLLATDSRDLNASHGRSDVMIIASLNMRTNEIKLASLSRDMWVPIPNGVGDNKLNAAYAFGGPLLAMKTVNQVFEMNLEDYVVVNFQTMADIVDTLGGVDIYLEGMEYAYINYNVAVSEDFEGFAKSASRKQLSETDTDAVVRLDGLQAVSYARIRKMDSDFQRGSRQRVLLQAMMDKAMGSLSLSTFYGLASNLLNSTSTNLKLNKVIEIGTWLLSSDSFPTMSELSIPVAGSYRSDTEKEMSVIKYSRDQNVTALHEFLFGAYTPAAAAP